MMLLPRIDCILDSRLLTLFTVIEVNSQMRFQSPLTDNIHIPGTWINSDKKYVLVAWVLSFLKNFIGVVILVLNSNGK